MGVEPKYHGVRSKFQGHDYLGFSVNHGRFGFWFVSILYFYWLYLRGEEEEKIS